MAEQAGHNVVNGPESAGASAHADVAANQTYNAPASDGKQSSSPAPSPPVDLNQTASRPTSNKYAIAPHSQLAPLQPANPSAGDVGMEQSDSSDVPASVLSHKAGLLSADGLAEDGRTTPVSVDHSVHSDTDTSRADAAEQGKDGLHSRTNSVKKPATFSKVSVTKNFLAKSATPPQATVRPGERPAPVGAPTAPVAKPRLVAKTGIALQNAQKAGTAGGRSTGPDASKVWNRNRPVAPPPPSKTLTDEQLKQQYGIHLATRLQTDDNGKEKNWADIDDDEDDWAPEAVVWMDGTKSTLAPTQDAAAVPAELQKQLPPSISADGTSLPKATTEPAKSSSAPKVVRPSGPPKTILKPGSAQLAKQQGASSSTSASGAAGLKAKSPAPTPTKSPWAPLPPVESVSPIHPPVQQASAATQAVLTTQDARVYESTQLQPTREIAADSFDRSWHEGEGGSRELFNSANGRYEPAAETRRGSMRTDRKPALLQRSGGMPAEPSAAFQSRTGTQMDGPWARRRASSISQGSLPPGRRISMSRGSDLAPPSERQSSTASGPDSRNQAQDPKADATRPSFAQPWPWEAQMLTRTEAGAPTEDPVKVQERVMREKRELAIKRRKEEEERQEAEKQERIKARLAALEGAGKSRKEREAEAAASAATVPTIKETSMKMPPGKEGQPSTEKGNVESIASAPQELPASTSSKSQIETLPERVGVVSDVAPRQPQRGHLSSNATTAPLNQQQTQQRQTQSSYSSPGDRKAQPFERSPLTNGGPFSPWGPATSNGNVWGSSGIGNGTFEKASSFAPRPMQGSNLPPPPGMPGIMRQGPQRLSPQAQGQDAPSGLQQSQVSEPLRNLGTLGIDSPPEKNWVPGRNGAVPSAPGLSRQPHAPGPIAPPSRAQQQSAQHSEGISAWNRAAQAMQFESVPNDARNDTASASLGGVASGTVKATFKQTGRAATLGGPRRLEQTEYSVIDGSVARTVSAHSPMPPNAQTQPAGPFTTAPALEDSPNFIGNTVRIPDGSRNPAHGGLPAPQPPIGSPSVQTGALTSSPGNVHFRAGPLAPAPSPADHSPPPPEESSASKLSRPKVRLPPPPPVVKLPPAFAASHPSAPRHPPNYVPNGQHRPLTQNPDWQARFNGLFGRTPIHTEVPPSPPGTPPKTQGAALAVASSSKAFLDHSFVPAMVSLPRSSTGFTIDNSGDVLSKPSIEPIFYEELSFGSLPKINLPRAVYAVDFSEHSKVSPLNRDGQLKKAHAPETQTKIPAEEYRPILFYKEVGAYFLRIPGSRLSNKPVHYEVTGDRRGSQTPGNRKQSGKYPRTRGREGDGEGQWKGGSARPSSGRKVTTPGSPTGEANPRKKSSHFKKARGGAQTAVSVASVS